MTITDDLRTEAWSPASKLPLVLLTMSHADLTSPIRVVNNNENITSNGETYIAFPFEIVLPDSTEDSPPRARLQISNVSREIGQAIRSISSPPSLLIQVVRPDAPDTVEVEFVGMRLANVLLDALMVSGEVEFEDLSREPFPGFCMTPSEFPGLVGG